MATVPKVDPFSVALNPVRAPAQQSVSPAAFTAEADQQIAMGQGLMKGGNAISAVAVKEIERVNEARIHEKYSLLSKAVNESIYGEKGVLTKQGKDAVGSADQWSADFERISGEVTQDLNPAQKAMFERYRQSLQRGAYGSVLRHEAGQARAYEDATFKNLVSTARETAGLNFTDTPMVNMQMDIATEALRKRREYQGASADVRATMEKELRGGFHAQVIESALTARNTAFANTYLDQIKGELPLELKNKIEARLKPATDFEEGRALALDVQDKIKSGAMSISDGEAYLTKNAKSKESLSVAQSVMREMQDAQKREVDRVAGSFVERFERSPTRASMNAIMGDQNFLKMEPQDRAKLLKYFRAEIEQADDRYRARRNEQYRQPEVFERFMQTLEDPKFATMTREEIYALQPTLGPQFTAKLLAEQKGRVGAAQSFKIDKDILDEAVPKDLLKPANKDKLKAFRGVVESNFIEWKMANPGKVPSLDEQKRIANSANQEWISLGWWDSNKPLYEAVKDPNAVPRDFFEQARSWAKQNKRSLSDAEIVDMWNRQQLRDRSPIDPLKFGNNYN